MSPFFDIDYHPSDKDTGLDHSGTGSLIPLLRCLNAGGLREALAWPEDYG